MVFDPAHALHNAVHRPPDHQRNLPRRPRNAARSTRPPILPFGVAQHRCRKLNNHIVRPLLFLLSLFCLPTPPYYSAETMSYHSNPPPLFPPTNPPQASTSTGYTWTRKTLPPHPTSTQPRQTRFILLTACMTLRIGMGSPRSRLISSRVILGRAGRRGIGF